MKLWHCFNCSTDFEAESAKCRNCGAEDESGRPIIAARLVIHYDPPHPIIKGRGKGHHACDPKVKVGTQGMRATGFSGSVTCPACKASEAWKADDGLLTNPMAYRVPEPNAIEPVKVVAEEVTAERTERVDAAKGEA